MGLRDKFKQLSREINTVYIDDLKENIYLRKMNGAERVKYLSILNKNDDAAAFEAQDYILAASLCESDGKRLYSDDELDKVGEEIPAHIIDTIVKEIAKYNGFGVDELKQEVKNSEPTQKSDS